MAVGNITGSDGSESSCSCTVESRSWTTLSIMSSKAEEVIVFDGNELGLCKFAEEVDDCGENDAQVDFIADTIDCIFSEYEATARCRLRLLHVPPMCNGK